MEQRYVRQLAAVIEIGLPLSDSLLLEYSIDCRLEYSSTLSITASDVTLREIYRHLADYFHVRLRFLSVVGHPQGPHYLTIMKPPLNLPLKMAEWE